MRPAPASCSRKTYGSSAPWLECPSERTPSSPGDGATTCRRYLPVMCPLPIMFYYITYNIYPLCTHYPLCFIILLTYIYFCLILLIIYIGYVLLCLLIHIIMFYFNTCIYRYLPTLLAFFFNTCIYRYPPTLLACPST